MSIINRINSVIRNAFEGVRFMPVKLSYNYEVIVDGEEPEPERTTVYPNSRVDIMGREIIIRDRDTEKILFKASRRDILKITRLPLE
jgi:hypothetical protein